MKRARDIRDQLLGLIDRCEIELLSNPQDVGACACLPTGPLPHAAVVGPFWCCRCFRPCWWRH
jgi:hypothetical protein